MLAIACLCVSCDADGDYLNGVSYEYYDGALEDGNQYIDNPENPFIETTENDTSTFSVDADGGSYANTRRYITQLNQLPPSAAVRTEEFLNYFKLDYPYTDTSHPVNVNGEISDCPWTTGHKLVRIGLQGKPIDYSNVNSNYVFLIDVSGSMNSEDKLTLLKEGFKSLVDELDDDDKVAIVTYAGDAAVMLSATYASEKTVIKNAIDNLGTGGGTAGAQGILTAYDIAEANFIENGNNRIIIGTDGDFNIGISNHDELIELIETKRETGIYLTVLGVGYGNLNDATLEQIANKGNGNYEYIDSEEQLKKVFLYDFNKFFTVAKDVKVQVVFNPEMVFSYRLIGYENRLLSEEDFEDDEEDAGEIGADQNITALYEIVPATGITSMNVKSFTIDFRYKEPDSDTSIPMTLDVFDEQHTFENASDNMKFVASLASFSMLLKDSAYKGTTSYQEVLNWIANCNLTDTHGFKQEYTEIVTQAATLQ